MKLHQILNLKTKQSVLTEKRKENYSTNINFKAKETDKVSFKSQKVELTSIERNALEELKSLKPKVPESIFFITDPNKDPDDLESFVVSSKLQKDGHIKVEGAVTTLGNEEIRTKRALFTKGVFEKLGLKVPVGVGSNYTPASEKRFKDDQMFLDDAIISNKTFLTSSSAEKGEKLLVDKLKNAKDKSLTIVINAGMKDVSDLIENNTNLFAQKVKKITIMGGISGFDNDGHVLPDERAYNNTTDISAAKIVYKKAQELEIPIKIVTKETAYTAAVPRTFYEALNETEHPVGKYLYGIQKTALEGLWGTVKKGIIPNLTPEWFVKTFTSIDIENTEHKELFEKVKNSSEPFETVWNKVTKLNLYDPINLLVGAMPDNNCFFKSIEENKLGKSLVQRIEVIDAEKIKALLSGLSKLALK